MDRREIIKLWDLTPEELQDMFREYYEYQMYDLPDTVQSFMHQMGNIKEYNKYKNFMANKEKCYKEKEMIIEAVEKHLKENNRKLNKKNKYKATLDEYKNYYELFIVGGRKWYY